jgi:serine/threonine protein kinase/Flp pilus assembly protein TadD
MICSRCGSEIPVSANSCPRCNASRVRTTATGLQTPPPATVAPSRPGLGDALTIFPDSVQPEGVPVADAQTMIPEASSARGSLQGEAPTVLPGTGGGGASSEDGPLEVGSAFGARYHIIRLLGIGGMGAVYQAWDAELGVAVAIKVIRPEVMADPTAAAEVERRFKRELLLAREVTHKNVVRIHDLGDIQGIKYITMPYIDGADLATISKNEGRLSVPKVLRIARGIVSGLVAAHTASVVHRDLKPANIMIGADDEAMIMDFGIALSSGAPSAAATVVEGLPTHFTRSAARFSTTMAGAVVGTVEYMAPEQARGQTVDQRADIYAFGLILYDLLVGRRRAEHAPSAIAELQGRMEQPPPPPRSVVPETPEALDSLVARCLEPDREKRYQTSAELAADLERLDENGVPIPLPRRFTPRMIAAAVVLVAGLVTGTWWLTRTPPVPKKHDPVLVLIADFNNTTNDPTFDHTLEPMLKLALEGADFINAYDRNRIRQTFGVQPPEKLDEAAARQLAVNQGVGVVVSGSIERQGNGYDITLKAAQSVTGKVVATTKSRASNKDQVVGAATKLVTAVRKALGDEKSDSAQLLAMKSLSTASMEVAGHYAAAIEAQSNTRFEEARQSFLKTVELDPNFGLGYQGLALMSRNLGKLQDADKYTTEALKHLDGMTDRERFAVRASYYMNTGDFQQCVKEYGELIAQYAADASGHNNRGLCLSKLRNMREAADEMRQAVQILPKRVMYRANLAMFGDYSGDFQTAERDAKAMEKPNDMATLAMVFAHLGQGRVPETAETYKKLEAMGARGASWAASGLADLALYEGRFSDAVRAFEHGAAADLASKNPDKAARKLTSLAYVHLMRGQKGLAIAAADKALLNSKAVPIRFLAARIFVEADAVARARTIAQDLSNELPAEPHAYGKIVEGEIALKSGDPRQAIKILTDANGILDTWLSHFDLGRAYLELRAFPQADSEFDRCIKRRGEALSLLVDEEPTYGYFPIVYYYQGRVREGLKNPGFADSYREYLKIRGKSTEDPLLPEVRRRVGG